MQNTRWSLLAVLTLGLAACGGGKSGASSPTDSIPDAAALTLEVTGGPAERAAAQTLPAALAAASAPTWPQTGDNLALAQKKIAAVNSVIRSILDHVADVATQEGAPWPGKGKWYGPKDRCTVEVLVGTACPPDQAATFRLWVGTAGMGRGGAFVLEAKAVGAADDTYKAVLAGWMLRGALPRRGLGQIWIDLDHLKLAASGYPGQGVLYGGFAAAGLPVVKVETLVLVAFTPDPNTWPAATVAFRGFKTAAGTARVRVAALDNYVSTTSADELGLFHVVYNDALGGRAFAIVTDYSTDGGVTPIGDVPAGYYYFGRSCYAAGSLDAPAFAEWFLCPKTEGPVACLADTGNQFTILEGTGWAQDCAIKGEPAEFGPPDSAPGVDPTALPSPLPGEDATGLTAQDPPAATDAMPAPG